MYHVRGKQIGRGRPGALVSFVPTVIGREYWLLVVFIISQSDTVPRHRPRHGPAQVFHSMRCDCREQLELALSFVQRHGGCVIYLQQEGRGTAGGRSGILTPNNYQYSNLRFELKSKIWAVEVTPR